VTLASPVPATVFRTVAGRRAARAATRLLLNVTVVMALTLFAFLAVGPRLLPYQTVTMLSGSMRPAVPTGAVAVEVPEPVSALRVGQVISFHAPVAGHPVVTHRVVAVERRGSQVLVRTRGDANTGVDPWLAVVRGSRVWQVRAVIPHLGSAIRLLRRPLVHALVAWVAPVVLLLWLLAGIWRRPAPASTRLTAEGGAARCTPSGSSLSQSSARHASSPRTVRLLSRHRRRRQLSR
jgi:signal peptidase I